MNTVTIVIPSKLYENQLLCIEAIRKSGCTAPVIVVQDTTGIGNPPHGRPGSAMASAPGVLDPIRWIRGAEPFVFARNANLGIAAAGTDDVLLLNDDAIWMSGSIYCMARIAQDFTSFGIIAPALTGLVNEWQRPQPGSTLLPRGIGYIPFVAVYLRRQVLDLVGTLDERFITYGGDDVDYCRRIRNAGFSMAVYHPLVFNHGAVASTFRGRAPADAKMCEPGWAIYEAKWGDRRA